MAHRSPRPTRQSSDSFGRGCPKHGPKMRSSARNSVSSVSPTGSGSSTRSMAPRSSSRVIRTGESTLLWRFEGPRRSRSSPLPRCAVVGGRPEVAVPSSRHGHARTAGRGASGSVRHRCSLMPCSMLWTTSPEPVSHRVRLAHRRAPYRSSSSFVAKSMPSWSSAATSGITRHGFSSSSKPAAVSPIEPEDARAIKVAACTRTQACTVSYSLRFTTQRAPDRRGSGEETCRENPGVSCSRWCCRRRGRRGTSRPAASAPRTACSRGRRCWRAPSAGLPATGGRLAASRRR
jgi:hypothetical protein